MMSRILRLINPRNPWLDRASIGRDRRAELLAERSAQSAARARDEAIFEHERRQMERLVAAAAANIAQAERIALRSISRGGHHVPTAREAHGHLGRFRSAAVMAIAAIRRARRT
jgi:hypothetical protein